MIEKFFPDIIVDKVENLGMNYLRENDIKALIIDIYNTICEWKTGPTDSVKAWIDMMKNNGIKLCLVSNNKRYRVEKVSKTIGISAIHGAKKPLKGAFLSAVKLMNVSPEACAVVGDQVFTDIYGGNRLNMNTIYVKPICKKDYLFVRMKRFFEKFVLYKFKRATFEQTEKRTIWKYRSAINKLR